MQAPVGERNVASPLPLRLAKRDNRTGSERREPACQDNRRSSQRCWQCLLELMRPLHASTGAPASSFVSTEGVSALCALSGSPPTTAPRECTDGPSCIRAIRAICDGRHGPSSDPNISRLLPIRAFPQFPLTLPDPTADPARAREGSMTGGAIEETMMRHMVRHDRLFKYSDDLNNLGRFLGPIAECAIDR